jgi:hypothetical protein
MPGMLGTHVHFSHCYPPLKYYLPERSLFKNAPHGKILKKDHALIEHQKYKRFLWEDAKPFYFLHKSLTCWGDATEGEIGASEAPQKRLEWENIIFFAASNICKFKVVIY